MLQIEAGRHQNLLMPDRSCVFCKELDIVLEAEYHLCHAYTELKIYTEYNLQQLYRNTSRN